MGHQHLSIAAQHVVDQRTDLEQGPVDQIVGLGQVWVTGNPHVTSVQRRWRNGFPLDITAAEHIKDFAESFVGKQLVSDLIPDFGFKQEENVKVIV